jgi:hypothetical protein
MSSFKVIWEVIEANKMQTTTKTEKKKRGRLENRWNVVVKNLIISLFRIKKIIFSMIINTKTHKVKGELCWQKKFHSDFRC